jgi:hypothetical protein
MRCSRSWGPAALAILLAMPLTGALAEDAELDSASAEGSQLEPAGPAADPQHTANNLNTVPEDGMGSQNRAGPDNLLVRRLIAARPNEDLVICVAGCFSGRDRVVYAQPADKRVRIPVASQSSLSGPMQNPGQKIDRLAKPGKAVAADAQFMPLQDPHAPAVVNPTN